MAPLGKNHAPSLFSPRMASRYFGLIKCLPLSTAYRLDGGSRSTATGTSWSAESRRGQDFVRSQRLGFEECMPLKRKHGDRHQFPTELPHLVTEDANVGRTLSAHHAERIFPLLHCGFSQGMAGASRS